MKRKFLILLCLILFFVSVACVSAEDSNQTIEDTLSASLDTIGAQDNGTFTALQEKIDNASEGSEIYLENDYVHGGSESAITIAKAIKINGNGHVIDALGQSGIFNIASNKITLNNITFKNGNADAGGAIYFAGNALNCSVSGNFINNTADNGGAIYFYGDASECNISGNFIDNSAKFYGGAICFDGNASDCSVSGDFMGNAVERSGGAVVFSKSVLDCNISGNFINNTAENKGGAICFSDNPSDTAVFHCIVSGNFKGNTASSGGAVYFGSKSKFVKSISECRISGSFLNNSADNGGAIFFYGNVSDCAIFGDYVANCAKEDGGAINFWESISNFLINANFINNTASGGGAIIFSRDVSSCAINSDFRGNVAEDYGGALEFNRIFNSYITSDFIGNAARYGGGIYLFKDVSDSYFSGKFINNTGVNYGSAMYFRGNVENSLINRSIFISNDVHGENIDFGDICWFGNNASNYDSAPLSAHGDSWLFLNASSAPIPGYDGVYEVVFGLNNLYNSSSTLITHPDNPNLPYFEFKLSAVNADISPTFADPGRGVILKSTGNGSAVAKAQYNGVYYSLTVNNLNLNAPDLTKYYQGPERFVVTVSENNVPVVGKNVTINLNGVDYNRTTDANGRASMAINLNSGVYNVTSEFKGIKIKSTITVKSTVSGKDITKIFRNGTQYYATFVDTSGSLMRNEGVSFNINGVFYTRTTNDEGVARLNINLNPGEYIITAQNPNSGEQYTNLITVLPSIVEVHNLTKYYKNASKLTFKLLDDEGNPVGEGVAARININGVFYERKTNASGYVNMNINLNPGTYVATLEYNGLMASSTVNVLPVLEAKDINMSYKDGTKFEAKLLDGEGRPFAGQNLTFNINGVFYSRITDENGIARLNINLMAGEYIITSMYEPNGAALSNKIVIRS